MLLDKQETRINLLIIIIFNFLLFLILLFRLDDYLFCSMFFLYLSSLLFIKLLVICWNAVPCFCQFLCDIANGYAGIFSFGLEWNRGLGRGLPIVEGRKHLILGDLSSLPGSGRSHGGRHGNPLQYSCLENPMDRGAWWPTAHGVTKELDTT